MPPNLVTQRCRIAKQGEDVRVGQQTAQGIEDLFPPTPVHQPIMNDGNAHCSQGTAESRLPINSFHQIYLCNRAQPWYSRFVNRRQDPLAIDYELPLRGTFHPVGFELHIATNSQDVLDAAEESWNHYRSRAHPGEALEFRVVVQDGGALCGETSHRAQGHLYGVVSDRDNFASLDLAALRASVFISRATAQDHPRLRWYFLESLAYMLLAQRHVVPVHAGCVAREGRAVLLCGPTQAGKSTLAYACARAGWTYISDDAVFLIPGCGRKVIGRHRHVRFRLDAPRLFPELERFVSVERPNGKVSIEVPLEDLPEISAATSAEAACAVVLHRGKDCEAQPITAGELTAVLLRDMPSYGRQVNAIHEQAVANLARVPAYRLHYQDLDAAIARLGGVVQKP